MNILLSEKTYDESFIREILRLDSNKLDLLGLRDKLLSSGKTKEARLITLILPAGESFDHTYESISELEQITRTSRLSKFSEVYLGRVLSHHYRYLGLHDCAKSIFSKYSEYESEDRRLNVYILNAKFMNRYKELYSHGSFAEELKGDSRRLADSYRKHFDADISSMDISAFREALSVSFQCAALKGLYLQNLCMTATTEKEALSALTEIDAYRKLVVQTLNIDEKRYQVIRSYGEALWWYGRVATIAFLKSWDRVVERCLASFYDSASITNQAEVNIFNDFHQSHKQSLRSPVWLQMALVCTMWNEVRRGDGQLVLTKLIAEENNYQFKHNVEVLRSYNALTVVFGRSPIEIPVSQALAQTEHGILLDCIRTMLKRRASL